MLHRERKPPTPHDTTDKLNLPGLALPAWTAMHPVRVIALFYTCCAAFIIVTAPARVEMESYPLAGDGFYYYVYARSLVIDHDVNFRNEYESFAPPGLTILQATPEGSFRTHSGPLPEYPDNYFAIGSGILWLPAVAIVHAGILGLQAAGFSSASADGFSLPYQVGVGVLGCFYAFLATWLIYRTLSLRFSRETALLTCLFLMTTTASINYVTIDPFYSHITGLFASSLVLTLCLQNPSFVTMRLRYAFWIGAALGLAAMVRWQIVLFGMIPFVLWVRDLWHARQPGRILLKGLVVAIGAALAFLPQVIAWNSIFGAYFLVPQGASFVEPRLLGWLQVMFSNDHGMFFWHPIVGLAAAGLLLSLRRISPPLGELGLPLAVGFVVFLTQAIINGLVSDLNSGTSFGARRMIATYPILAWGLAFLLAGWRRGPRAWWPTALWFGASIWNMVLLGMWLLRIGGSIFPR